MVSPSGIGKRLLLAFLIVSLLSLVPGVGAWVILRDVAGAQSDLSDRALPAVTDAQALAEASDRLVALGPRLRESGSDSELAARSAEIDRLRTELHRLTALVENRANATESGPLPAAMDRLIENLGRQRELVAERLTLRRALDADVSATVSAASDLVDLSESLVSNALAVTYAVVADLYVQPATAAGRESLLAAVDQLVERDLFTLVRMTELRLAASQVGLLAQRFHRAETPEESRQIAGQLLRNLDTIARRVEGIADPIRRDQARSFRAILGETAPGEGSPVLARKGRLFAIDDTYRRLTDEAEADVGTVRSIVGAILAGAKADATETAARARQGVRFGLFVLVGTLAAALALSILVVWRFVERRVVRPLEAVTDALRRLSDGDAAVAVAVAGPAELRELSRAVVAFRDESARRRTLEEEREATNRELRRHREELQVLVAEQTALLQAANERLQSEAEEHAFARARAEMANRAKTEFLAVISHEIRTPLTGLMGTIDLLHAANLSPEQHRWASDARKASRALLGVLDSILGYSKAETTSTVPKRAPFSLRTLADRVLTIMRPVAEAKGLALQVCVDDRIWETHSGDADKIQQILLNLTGNAIKFTDRGRIDLRFAVIGDDGGRQSIAVAVADTGIGIPADQLSRIFDPFVQVDSSMTRSHGGTGLGLAICRRLAAVLGADLAVESEPGVGTTFTFRVDLDRGDGPEHADRVLPAPTGAGRRVLVLEDDETTRRVVRTYLERLGYAVGAAADESEATELAAAFRPDLILTDISLPGSDGLDVADRLRLRLGSYDMPVVCMSAHVFSEDVDRFVARGADGYVAKPIVPADLAATVAQALDRDADGVDRTALAGDLAALGPAVVADLIRLARETIDGRLAVLSAALDGGNREAFRSEAHALRSTAGSIHLTAVGRHAARLEAHARTASPDILRGLVDVCAAAAARGLAALDAEAGGWPRAVSAPPGNSPRRET